MLAKLAAISDLVVRSFSIRVSVSPYFFSNNRSISFAGDCGSLPADPAIRAMLAASYKVIMLRLKSGNITGRAAHIYCIHLFFHALLEATDHVLLRPCFYKPHYYSPFLGFAGLLRDFIDKSNESCMNSLNKVKRKGKQASLSSLPIELCN
jgi:hypothetical protein